MITSLVSVMLALDMESIARRRPSGDPPPPRRTPLVGRERELSSLAERLNAAARGEGGVVLVSGEPGIGKSRLLLEIEARAQAAGWLVLSGRAYDTEGMPPYLAFAEAIGQYLRTGADDQAGPRLVAAAREVALLVPELRERLPDAGAGPSLGPEADRYHRFEAVCDFFLRLSATSEATGLLLCLDDLHWADRSTLLLFQHLARKLRGARLLVVATFRTEELEPSRPLFGALAELTRERLQQTITLASLSLEECASLIGQLAPGPPDPAVVGAIYERTEGNPFFVEEVVHQLLAEGRDLADGGLAAADWGIPEGVRQVIGQRLSRLRPATKEALQTAAILGHAFAFDLLAEASEMDSRLLIDAVEEAERAGMLRPEGDGYAFAHALIRQTVYDELSPPRRRGLHRRAAEAMETVYAARLEPHVAALANHYRLAGGAAGLEKAVAYSIRAGEAAEAALAFEESEVHWDAALQLMEARGGDLLERAGLLERLGLALQAAGFEKYEKSLASMEQALAIHEQLGGVDAASRLHARLGFMRAFGYATQDNDVALRHLEAARPYLDWVDAPPCEAQLSLYNGLGLVAVWQLRAEQGLAFTQKAMEIAEELGRREWWANAAVLHASHLYDLGRIGAALDWMARAWEAADQLNDPFRAYVAASWLALRLDELGDQKEARAWFEKERGKPRQGLRRRNLDAGIAVTWLEEGRLEMAARTSAESGMFLGNRMTLDLYTGAWSAVADQARSGLEAARVAGNVRNQVSCALLLARACEASGDSAGAIALLREVAALCAGRQQILEVTARSQLAICLAEANALAEARDHLAVCRDYTGNGEHWRGLDGREMLAEAVYAAASGRSEEAEGHFERAVVIFRDMTLPWDEAEAFEVWARSCRRFHRGHSRRAFVEEKLSCARAIYERIGAGQPWLDRLEAEERRLAGAAEAGGEATYPDGLTHREIDVLRLIAQGHSNREIAGELVLSIRTVGRHITNIYAKIGARGKADATAYALRHSLV